MVPLESEPAERRFELARKRLWSLDCKNDKSLIPFWKMLIADREKYAVATRDKELNDSFRHLIDETEFGLKEADRRSIARHANRLGLEQNERK